MSLWRLWGKGRVPTARVKCSLLQEPLPPPSFPNMVSLLIKKRLCLFDLHMCGCAFTRSTLRVYRTCGPRMSWESCREASQRRSPLGEETAREGQARASGLLVLPPVSSLPSSTPNLHPRSKQAPPEDCKLLWEVPPLPLAWHFTSTISSKALLRLTALQAYISVKQSVWVAGDCRSCGLTRSHASRSRGAC